MLTSLVQVNHCSVHASASRLIGSTARTLSSISAAAVEVPFLSRSEGDPELPLDLVGSKPRIDRLDGAELLRPPESSCSGLALDEPTLLLERAAGGVDAFLVSAGPG